jgi:hypothetical protein
MMMMLQKRSKRCLRAILKEKGERERHAEIRDSQHGEKRGGQNKQSANKQTEQL